MAYVGLWLYLSVLPFTWARAFFGLRGHRGLGQRWLLASALALLWPLYWLQFALWRRQITEVTWVDQLEKELQAF